MSEGRDVAKAAAASPKATKAKGPGTEGWALSQDSEAIAEAERQFAREENETDEEYLTRSCRFACLFGLVCILFILLRLICGVRYCIGGLDEDIERVLHCDGIWLHALQYQGASWRFRTRLPNWARDVLLSSNNSCGAGSTGSLCFRDDEAGAVVNESSTAAATTTSSATTASATSSSIGDKVGDDI